jgi:hypothetical protein
MYIIETITRMNVSKSVDFSEAEEGRLQDFWGEN